jgi:hypothetical protein
MSWKLSSKFQRTSHEWTGKRDGAQFAAEHELPEARAQLKEGYLRWLDDDYHKEIRASKHEIQSSTDIVMWDD